MFGDTSVSPERPDIDFAEVVLPDPLQMAQTANALAGAEAASKQVLVQMIHPDWTQADVDEEVSRIYAEIGSEVLGRARITLQGQPDETLQEDIQDIASTVAPPPIPRDIPGPPDTGGNP
jgi:hypothetical protein